MTKEPSYNDSVAKAVIDNMDKQIAPSIWYALKTKKYDKVKEMMTQRQQLIDRMKARREEEEKKDVRSKGVVRRRKSVHR